MLTTAQTQTQKAKRNLPLEIRLLDAGGKKALPTEVRIFPFGEIQTSKGTLRFTKKSADLVKKQWETLRRSFGFDYAHDTFDSKKPGAEKIAAGWSELTIKPDGLYATKIEWTPDAAKKIANKEFRYLSPACADQNGEIVAVYNCALTNLPATYDAKPLVLSAPSHLPARSDSDMPDNKHKALGQALNKHMTGLMGAAKDASESDHEGLKAYGAKLCEMMPEHYSALQTLMTDLGMDHEEPDGDEGEPDGDEPVQALSAEPSEADKQLQLLTDTVKALAPGKEENLEASIKEAFQVLSAVQQVTGKQTGLVGAILAMGDSQKRQPKQDPAVQRAVDKGIKLRKIHPADAQKFLGMSLEDVESYVELAAPIDGPRSLVDVEGSARIDGSVPKDKKLLEAEKAARVRADELLKLAFDTSDEEAE